MVLRAQLHIFRPELGGPSGLLPEGPRLLDQQQNTRWAPVDLLQPQLAQREPNGVEARVQGLLQSKQRDRGHP
jgi:hypothetical protein